MKTNLLTALSLLVAMSAYGQYASQTFLPVGTADRTVYFATNDEGEYLPILWGLDTAWPDEYNMRRGVRFIGAENIGVARVSFQPWDFMLNTTTLTDRLENNLQERLRLVSYIGGPDKVKIVLNNDAPGDVYDTRYSNPSVDADALDAYCNLIYATTLSCQEKGWEVITASPLNEPDYIWNGQGSMEDFYAIAKKLKTEYPQYKDGTIRISGGNTLNCDQATPWYLFLYDYIDEGNTHQLAGDFDHYADFFKLVREDGKYATADELHNVMEAMVGVEYGMQTGIWWGTAELARGEFCKASFGRRLGYAENRDAWTSAAVYRAPDNRIQAFVGSSERQARKCTYRFVSTDRDVYYNGQGPQREYLVNMPGGNGYQDGQTSAECVVDITWGEDVSPVIDGNYIIMNKYSQKLMSFDGEAVNLAQLRQYAPSQGTADLWEVVPVPTTIGGDFSYHSIKLAQNTNMKLDVLNWSLEDGTGIILYDGGMGGNEQWYLKYAGDGYFRIFSRHSNLCLQLAEESAADGVAIVQATPSDSPLQLWRMLPADAPCETEAPAAPTGLTATSQSASVLLEWSASTSADAASYTILRAEAGADEFTTIGRGITTEYFVDNTVIPGRQYDYKIKCQDYSLNQSATTETVTCASNTGRELTARYMFNRSLADETDNHFDALNEGKVKYMSGYYTDKRGLWLNGTAIVQLPYQSVAQESLTVAAWLNWEGSNRKETILDFGRDLSHSFSVNVNGSGTITVTLTDGTTSETLEAGTLKAKAWQHLAVTVTGERVAVYLDGELCGEAIGGLGATVADIMPATNYIGCNQAQEEYFVGTYQDLRLYNYAVADSDITKLMSEDLGGIDTIATELSIVSTEYYNLAGIAVANPKSGIYLVRRTYSDGSTDVKKQYTY